MIRSMTKVDCPTVKELMQSVPGFWHDGWDESMLNLAFSTSEGLSFVYQENERIVGMVIAHEERTDLVVDNTDFDRPHIVCRSSEN